METIASNCLQKDASKWQKFVLLHDGKTNLEITQTGNFIGYMIRNCLGDYG